MGCFVLRNESIHHIQCGFWNRVVTGNHDYRYLATRTVQVRDANGGFGVVSVDTTKSDNIHAIQVQIGPSEVVK